MLTESKWKASSQQPEILTLGLVFNSLRVTQGKRDKKNRDFVAPSSIIPIFSLLTGSFFTKKWYLFLLKPKTQNDILETTANPGLQNHVETVFSLSNNVLKLCPPASILEIKFCMLRIEMVSLWEA